MTTEKEAIAETITAHDLLLKKLWCIAYTEGRAEALEEAEEIAKTIGGSFAEEFLAAIRGLK